jgi:hypothetical protein
MLDKIKLLLSKSDDDTVDELIQTLISLCKEEAYVYCNLDSYSDKLDYIVVQMVIERYNRIGSEGATSQSSSGVSNSYDSYYSEKVRKALNKHRKVRMV